MNFPCGDWTARRATSPPREGDEIVLAPSVGAATVRGVLRDPGAGRETRAGDAPRTCKRRTPARTRGFWIYSRQRPTLPHTFACSTIGAEGLNFRVRDGNGCGPFAMVTGNFLVISFSSRVNANVRARQLGVWHFEGLRRTISRPGGHVALRAANENIRACGSHQREDKLGQASRPISTGKLNVLPRLHPRPINVVVSNGSSGACAREISSRGGLRAYMHSALILSAHSYPALYLAAQPVH